VAPTAGTNCAAASPDPACTATAVVIPTAVSPGTEGGGGQPGGAGGEDGTVEAVRSSSLLPLTGWAPTLVGVAALALAAGSALVIRSRRRR